MRVATNVRKGVLASEHVQVYLSWSYFDLAIIRKPHIPDAQLSICWSRDDSFLIIGCYNARDTMRRRSISP